MKVHPLFLLLIYYTSLNCQVTAQDNFKVKTGAEILIESYLSELESRNIGLVMNPTARIGSTHVLDTLLSHNIQIRALYSPEHGFRGEFSDGEIINDGIDQESGLPVYSLYGSTTKPTTAMLQGIDLLLFDMQDVGARFYTFNATMRYVIEAATEQGIEVWILDRPNPAGGEYVSGWILDSKLESMVGTHETPIAHGMTLGELALMGIGEGWYDLSKEPKLKIIEMEGWNRSMKWPETGLPWFPPSPNLPTFEHAFTYLGTCLIEGTTISEGRGTDDPFLTIGAPDFKAKMESLQEIANRYSITIDTLSFKPISIPGKSMYPKYQDETLRGIKISVTENFSSPVEFGVEITNYFLKNSTSAKYREYMNLLAGYQATSIDSLIMNWDADVDSFLQKRNKYLLYR